jgi:SAM-dependent methyltransferase
VKSRRNVATYVPSDKVPPFRENSVADVFSGAMPQVYQDQLVPLIFAPYAADIADRVRARRSGDLLEIACGTGAVTRALASTLPRHTTIVATDLNAAMLEEAKANGTARPVEWRQADAMQLPFADQAFDAVVCQFGVMFFPDKAKGFAEFRRVLRPGGVLLFNVWDRLSENEFADSVETAVAAMFPADPPRFLSRTPYAYHDRASLARDLAAGGFAAPARIDTVTARSRAEAPRTPALAFCQGTPLRSEIEARDRARLAEATDVASEEIARRFGRAAVDGRIQAHVVVVER